MLISKSRQEHEAIERNLSEAGRCLGLNARDTNQAWLDSGWKSGQFLLACQSGWTPKKGWPRKLTLGQIGSWLDFEVSPTQAEILKKVTFNSEKGLIDHETGLEDH